MNTAALLKMWPSAKMGDASHGPVKGGSAECVDAGAHKGWIRLRGSSPAEFQWGFRPPPPGVRVRAPLSQT